MVQTQTGKPQRISHYINRKPASNIAHAVRVAEGLKLPLNQFVTFNFAHTECAEEVVSRQFKKLRDNYFTKWLSRKSIGKITPPAYVWSVENSGGCLNVHWLVHIPKGRVNDFKILLPKWLSAVAGEINCESAIHVRYAPTPQGAAKYISKGIDPVYANFFRIRHMPQGLVHGKRAGTSLTLGRSNRRRLEDEGKIASNRRAFRYYPSAAVGPT